MKELTADPAPADGALLELGKAPRRRRAPSGRPTTSNTPSPCAPAVLPILFERLDVIDRQITEVISALREVSRDAREAEPSPLFQPMFHGIRIRIQTEIRRVGRTGAAWRTAESHSAAG